MHRDESDFSGHFKPAPVKGGFAMEDYWVWCGSVVRGEDGQYHLFASRWPRSLPYHPGWGMASQIVRAVAPRPEGPYIFQEVVLGARSAAYWDGRSVHNPVIMKHGGTYVLFYIGMTYPYPDITEADDLNHHSLQWLASRASKRIGIATSKSVFGPWTRPDQPVLVPRPGHFDNFFVSNPAPCLNPDGSCLLVYKTRSYREPPYDSPGDMFSPMMLGVAYAEHYAGPYTRLSDEPLFPGKGVIEDPFVWRTSAGYAMIAKDWSGTYTGDVGSGVYASSVDGARWSVRENFIPFTRKVPWDDGTQRVMGNMDRPFILFDGDQMTHLFVATTDGSEASFRTMTRAWNACIPLS